MKIVILCSRFPYPLEKGDKLRVYHQIKGLSEYHDICLITLSNQELDAGYIEEVKPYTKAFHNFILGESSRYKSIFNQILTSMPFSIAYYYSHQLKERIDGIIDDFKPDHIYCHLTRMAEYVHHRKDISKTIDYMDAFGVSMEKRSRVAGFPYRMIYAAESKRMKRYEKEIFNSFDHHTVISESDKLAFEVQGIRPVHVIPNGVDTDFFSPIESEKKYDIGFIGNMGYPPNIEAAEYLVNKILPVLPRDTRVLLCGARPDKRVQDLASDQVTVSGWVDDIRHAYAESRIMVAPIWSGTGQQNKILEAMAMKVPCVTTSVVNQGIKAQDGMEIITADDEHEFIEATRKLLKDDSLKNQISERAFNFVKNQYSWELSIEKLNAVITSER